MHIKQYVFFSELSTEDHARRPKCSCSHFHMDVEKTYYNGTLNNAERAERTPQW